jgi:hypothetical protein
MHYFIEFSKIFFYELALVGVTWLTFFADYNSVGAQLKQMVDNINLTDLGARALYSFSKLQVQFNKRFATAYENSWVVRQGTDALTYGCRYVVSQWRNVRIEPFQSQWMSVCTLSRDPEDLKITLTSNGDHTVEFGYLFDEKFYNNPDWPKDRAAESFSVSCEVHAAFSKFEDVETLMLLKCGDLYLSRSVLTAPTKSTLSWTPSSVRFINIDYSHPKMMIPLSLTVETGFFLEGNHLFSAAFVRRCLEYQNNPSDYYFDTNYTLTIMDDQVNMRFLTSEDYVVLEKESYKVVKV